MNCYQKIKSEGNKFGFLIDPDNYGKDKLDMAIEAANSANVHFILLGGSLVSQRLDSYIDRIKAKTSIPIILFPGNLLQLSDKADSLLFLSLISGRNPEYLIGNHVLAAPFIKNCGIECIPTAYVLIDGGNVSSVEYISNTKPIPAEKTDIIVATAIAGELMGNKLLYLECGSGAQKSIDPNTVRKICQNVTIPVIVGGGLCSVEQITDILSAGAKMVVVGNALENKLDDIKNLVLSTQ